jgi:transcriptional regulator with XRE-family HTH domain
MEHEAKFVHIAASLGKEIERLRVKKGFSQEVLGLYCVSPVSDGRDRDYISQIETGRHIPTFGRLQEIAVAFETTASALLSKIGLSEQEYEGGLERDGIKMFLSPRGGRLRQRLLKKSTIG